MERDHKHTKNTVWNIRFMHITNIATVENFEVTHNDFNKVMNKNYA
jgi:hypothetical protein